VNFDRSIGKRGGKCGGLIAATRMAIPLERRETIPRLPSELLTLEIDALSFTTNFSLFLFNLLRQQRNFRAP